jgi:hypothetical protein
MSIAAYTVSTFDESLKPDPRLGVKESGFDHDRLLFDYYSYKPEYGGRICLSCEGKVYHTGLKKGTHQEVNILQTEPCKIGDVFVGMYHNHPGTNGGISPGDEHAAGSVARINRIQHKISNLGMIFVAYSRNYPFKKNSLPGENTPPTKFMYLTTEFYNGSKIVPLKSNIPFFFQQY